MYACVLRVSVINYRVSYKTGNFLATWSTINFSRRNLLCGIAHKFLFFCYNPSCLFVELRISLDVRSYCSYIMRPPYNYWVTYVIFIHLFTLIHKCFIFTCRWINFYINWLTQSLPLFIHSFIHSVSVLRQVHSPFQSEFSTERELERHLSIPTSLIIPVKQFKSSYNKN
jgi:hypothetical protein